MIIFAPSKRVPSDENNINLSVMFDLRVIQTLVDNFDIPIAMRTHPETDSKQVETIQAILGSQSQIIFIPKDMDKKYFEEADILITDVSRIGLSFLFSQQKPVIFYSPYRRQGDRLEEIDYYFKCHVSTLSDLVIKTSEFLKNREIIQQKIKNFSDGYFLDFHGR